MGDPDLEKLTELETLAYYYGAGNMEIVALGTDLENRLCKEGYLRRDKNDKTFTLTDFGIYRLEYLRHEKTKSELAYHKNMYEDLRAGYMNLSQDCHAMCLVVTGETDANDDIVQRAKELRARWE